MVRLPRGLAMALALAVSACSSLGISGPPPIVSAADSKIAAENAAKFAAVAVCPEVQVRDGTQLFRVFEKGRQDDFSAIRFQASVQKFARECHTDSAGTTTIKVGVAGRMLAGPSGATGSASLPVRIVLVRDGDEVLYSKLFKVDATIAAGMSSVDWNQVADDLTVPGDKSQGRFVIYVGFDPSGK